MLQYFPSDIIDDANISKTKTWSSLQIITSFASTFIVNTASGSGSVASGTASSATGANSVSFGKSATSLSNGTVAIGYNATIDNDSDYSISVGSDSHVYEGVASIAFGYKAESIGNNSVSFGPNSSAAGDNSIAVGNGAYATVNSVAIGNSAGTSTTNTIALVTSTGNTVYEPAEGNNPESWSGEAGAVVTKFSFNGGESPSLGVKVFQLNTATTGSTILDLTANLDDIVGFPARMKQISSDEIRITVGDEDLTWNWCEINSDSHLISGFVDAISIKCSSAGGTGSNLYLAIYQKDDAGTFQYVGTSQNSANYVAGGTMDYVFNNLSLTSNDIRLCPVTSRTTNPISDWEAVGNSFSTRTKFCSDGCYLHVNAVEEGDETTLLHAPDVTVSVYDNFLSSREFRELSSGERIISYGVTTPAITMEHNTWFQLSPSTTSWSIVPIQNITGVVKSHFKITPSSTPLSITSPSGTTLEWNDGIPYFAPNKTYIIKATQFSPEYILLEVEYSWA